MKIIQITDLHIESEGAETHGINIRQNFLNVLQAAVQRKPDLLVLTGDLCQLEGDEIVYKWIKKQVDEVNIPYEVIAGNHDESAMMAAIFQKDKYLIDNELYFSKNFHQQKIIFLDTAKAACSDQQLNWLKAELDSPEQPQIIFMHHPPVKGGVLFMDTKYAFQMQDTFQELLASYNRNFMIFCGHYHAERVIAQGNLLVHITPSTYYQIDGRFEDFQVDSRKVAYREIEIEENVVRSEVRFL